MHATAEADLAIQKNTRPKKIRHQSNRKMILGLVGSCLLAVGCFSPLISAPIVGSITYFNNGNGDGVLVLIFAGVAVMLTLGRAYRWLLLPAIASLAIIATTYSNMQSALVKLQASLVGNPFAGLATAQMQWGWGVLLVGAVLLIAAAVVPAEALPAPTAAAVPAGWYPDPQETGQQRHWNGVAWDDETPPAPVVEASAEAPQP